MGEHSPFSSESEETDNPGSHSQDQSAIPSETGNISQQKQNSSSAAGMASVSGPQAGENIENCYGVDISKPAQAAQLQRLAETNGPDTVRRWANEGIPIEAMGTPSKMAAYRQHKNTPVPWDIEQRNEQSKRRNTLVQRTKHGTAAGDTQVPESVRDVVSSPGQSLDSSIQRTMEDRMGEDFSDVQVHTGPKAAQAAESINAKAFTVGNHVAFNRGEYDPSSAQGQHVIAHELAHVRQQTEGAVSMLPQDDVELQLDPDPELEREAEQTAERVVGGQEIGIQRLTTDIHIQRRKYEKNKKFLEQRGSATEEIEQAPDSIPEHPAEVESDEELPKLGRLDNKKDASKDGVWTDEFYETYPELKEVTDQVHHALERQVLRPGASPYLPGIMTLEEMNSLENLRGIPDDISDELHQSVLRVEWNDIYKRDTFRQLETEWQNYYRQYVHENPNELSMEEAIAKFQASDVPPEMMELQAEIRTYLLERMKEVDKRLGKHFLPEMYTQGTKGDPSE